MYGNPPVFESLNGIPLASEPFALRFHANGSELLSRCVDVDSGSTTETQTAIASRTWSSNRLGGGDDVSMIKSVPSIKKS
jgi:hypothetical protein